jgi:hypothetical protein
MYHFLFNESYVWEREKIFQINPKLQFTISFQMSMQTITYQMTMLYVSLFQYFNNLKNFDFQFL